MAVLNIPDQKVFVGHFDKVQNYLNKRGIVLEKWNAKIELKDTDDQATVLKAYEDAMTPLMKKQGYQSADVISIHSGTPNLPAVRT
ncbi:MAG: cupin, partial [Spirochaetia bacterium]|nr:cupin [Spirochaetia bacterium]